MQEIKGLIKRIVLELDGMFDFEIIEKQNSKEVFELDSKDGRPVLRGGFSAQHCGGARILCKKISEI